MPAAKQPKLITVFGGSGFVGRYVVRQLAERGYRIRVGVRRPDLAGHLQPLGDLGQIKSVQANLRYPASVDAAAQGADVVVNLVGTFDKGGKNNFDAVQVMGARNVANAAKRAGARLVHISAIGADIDSVSAYGKTKGEGERVVLEIIKSAIIMRPSIVFGPEDDFFNRFGAMSRISPFLPLIGGGKTPFQPVYVGDVAAAIAKAVDGDLAAGKIYELGGPEILTFKECLERMLEEVDRSKAFLNMPFIIAKTFGKLIGWLPGAPITYDQVVMLETDNVVSDQAIKGKRTLQGMGIQPTTLASILPKYLVQYRSAGQFKERSQIN